MWFLIPAVPDDVVLQITTDEIALSVLGFLFDKFRQSWGKIC